MVVQSVGDKLRQARVRKGLQILDIEQLTGIDSHLILVLELDQFTLLSDEDCRSYLTTFSETVGLAANDIIMDYESQKNQKPSFNYDYSNDCDIAESNLFTGSVRQSRTQKHHSKKMSKRPILIGLAFLTFLGMLWFIYPYLKLPIIDIASKNDSTPKVNDSKKVEEKVDKKVDEKKEDVVTEPSTMITVEQSEGYLTATVQTQSTPVSVSFELESAESSWVALTNSNLGEGGILLDQVTKTYKTDLYDDTSNTWMTLGIVDGLSIKINDVKLDLSPFETASPTYVSLIIDKTNTTN